MGLGEWLLVGALGIFLVSLVCITFAYLTGRLKSGPSEPKAGSHWLPLSLRMRGIGHGVYHVHDERRRKSERPEEGDTQE